MATILPFPRVSRASPVPARAPVPSPAARRIVDIDTLDPAARHMVAAALSSWMQGDPLTQREQRIVETVLDTNYFGQLGRLAMGC